MEMDGDGCVNGVDGGVEEEGGNVSSGCAQRCVSEEERVVKAHTTGEFRDPRYLLALSSDNDRDFRVKLPSTDFVMICCHFLIKVAAKICALSLQSHSTLK